MKVVKYHATWCMPCKRFAPIVEKVATDLNITVEDRDIDEHPEDGIQSVPTIRVVDEQGNVTASHSGVMKEPQLREWLHENGVV